MRFTWPGLVASLTEEARAFLLQRGQAAGEGSRSVRPKPGCDLAPRRARVA